MNSCVSIELVDAELDKHRKYYKNKKCLNGGVRKTLLLQNDMKYQAYAYLFEIVIEINMKWFYPPARHEARM